MFSIGGKINWYWFLQPLCAIGLHPARRIWAWPAGTTPGKAGRLPLPNLRCPACMVETPTHPYRAIPDQGKSP